MSGAMTSTKPNDMAVHALAAVISKSRTPCDIRSNFPTEPRAPELRLRAATSRPLNAPPTAKSGNGSANSASLPPTFFNVHSDMPSASPKVQGCGSFDHSFSAMRAPGSKGGPSGF